MTDGADTRGRSAPPSAAWANLRTDLDRYRDDAWLGRLWWLTDRSVWAVVVYRLGQRVLEFRSAWLRDKCSFVMSLVATLTQVVTSIDIPPTTSIGPGMRIYHGTGLIINANAVIGRNVVLRHGVTIGALEVGGTSFPVIGDDVDFGAYAQVYGAVTVGNGAKIGTMSVVLSDVAPGVTVFGSPARVVRPKG